MCGRDPTLLLLHLQISLGFGYCYYSETRKNCKEFALFAARLAHAGFSVVVANHIETGPLVLVSHAAKAKLHVVTVVRKIGHHTTRWSLVLRALLLPASARSDPNFW